MRGVNENHVMNTKSKQNLAKDHREIGHKWRGWGGQHIQSGLRDFWDDGYSALRRTTRLSHCSVFAYDHQPTILLSLSLSLFINNQHLLNALLLRLHTPHLPTFLLSPAGMTCQNLGPSVTSQSP